ncbi:class I SAM-dependent methyltransferase [Paenibacillus sp. FSL R7-0273]|uniref:class I SAM-dependent methyltransferase n=1 Tax=Paenibacillus sp. FSL R7-0273 TaxID=1536772 RepID=UPI0006933010|nr:class I SAM-dependent methyltransferase [Paenibacillus sp. FSL R7-0273]OMF85577.1 hypothetical protein BK144_27795 [Paenibacillus sp. FSL R7-0273]
MNSPEETAAGQFDSLAADWSNSDRDIALAQKVVRMLGLESGNSLLDVASGTGVVPAALQSLGILPARYMAVDISSAMLAVLHHNYPEAELRVVDFEKPFDGGQPFDYVLLYNSIPHFTKLDMLFANAASCLKSGGAFMIAHSRTRQGLKEHHARIGYLPAHDPIPADSRLEELAVRYGFQQIIIQDEEMFRFSCSPPSPLIKDISENLYKSKRRNPALVHRHIQYS